MPAADLPPGFAWSTMVPELLASGLDASLRFWCGLCGFAVAYDCPEDRFACLDRASRQVMLEEVTAPLERPFGRGINPQITVDDVAPILASLDDAGWPLLLALEEVWCWAGTSETGGRQFLVQDADGYLVRLS